MTETNLDYPYKPYGIMNFLQDEIEKVKKKIPKGYDAISQFLAISRPIIELTLMNCGDWTDQIQQVGPGKPILSHVSLMLILILSKMRNVSYRQIEREINDHPSWLHALNLSKAPSHAKLSTFRKEKGESFFKVFFDNLTELLNRFNLIHAEEVIVDSAPIIASMNFARANSTPKINLDHVEKFFTCVDVSPAVQALYISRKQKYSPDSFIRFFIFEKLGKFLSTSQVLTYIKNHPKIAQILGFQDGNIPAQATFNYFIKLHGSIPQILSPMVDGVTEFFEMCEDTPEDTDIDFFFRSI